MSYTTSTCTCKKIPINGKALMDSHVCTCAADRTFTPSPPPPSSSSDEEEKEKKPQPSTAGAAVAPPPASSSIYNPMSYFFPSNKGDVPSAPLTTAVVPTTTAPKCCASSSSASFPKEHITGRVFLRTEASEWSSEWKLWMAHCYGYAFANAHEQMNPAAIIYAENDQDIRIAIQYAKDRDIAIAVRSGSHHYLGASSSCGDNIQIDVSGILSIDPTNCAWKQCTVSADKSMITCGPGVPLGEFGKTLHDAGLWLPFGECATVFMGGHSQSGGNSPAFSANYGYLNDYIQSFDVITPDCNKKTVYRNDPAQSQDDNDLFWALAGASPGNFGIVTSTTFKPFKDVDYQTVRHISFFKIYNQKVLTDVLELFAECHDSHFKPESEWVNPPGSAFHIDASPPGPFPLAWEKGPGQDKFDYEMQHNPALKMFWNRSGSPVVPNAPYTLFPNMSVSVYVYKAVGEDPETERVDAFFAKVEKLLALSPIEQIMSNSLQGIGNMKKLKHPKALAASMGNTISTMSDVMLAFCFPIEKEYPRRFEKHNVMGTQSNLAETDWAQFITKMFNDEEGPLGMKNTLKVELSLVLGGIAGRIAKPDGKSFHAWRSDNPSWFEWITWYGSTEEQGAASDAWLKTMDDKLIGNNGSGIFSPADRRLLALPFGSMNMDENKLAYWESEENYQRLLAVKKRVDPDWTFSPNLFGIGASQAPAKKARPGQTVTSPASPNGGKWEVL